jgi:hypothetical protein
MQTIKRLPKSVHSSLRSSIVLFDLSRVVEELVYNSIDANASKIDISVNARACYVKVEDDGCGITRDELVLVGEKYGKLKLLLLFIHFRLLPILKTAVFVILNNEGALLQAPSLVEAGLMDAYLISLMSE